MSKLFSTMSANNGAVKYRGALPTRAKAYMVAHHPEDLNLLVVARGVGAKVWELSKFFKNRGTSFADFLYRVRIGRAKTLLANSELNVPRVSTKVGFPQPSKFRRIFRRLEGESPTQFQRRVLEGSCKVKKPTRPLQKKIRSGH